MHSVVGKSIREGKERGGGNRLIFEALIIHFCGTFKMSYEGGEIRLLITNFTGLWVLSDCRISNEEIN